MILGFTMSIASVILLSSYLVPPPIQWNRYSEVQVKKESKKHKVLVCVLASWDISSAMHEHNFIDTPAVRKVIHADGVKCFRLDLVDLKTTEFEKWKQIFKSSIPMGVLIYHPNNPNTPIPLEVFGLSEEKILAALK